MAKKDELKNQAKAMLDTAQKEERPLNDDERSTISDLKSQISNWDMTIREMADLIEDTAPVAAPVTRQDAPQNTNTTKFTNLGEQLRAVYNAAQPNRPVVDERLLNSASGANESVPSDGGFLVQTDFATDLLTKAYDTNS